jgi:hypothetical protein
MATYDLTCVIGSYRAEREIQAVVGTRQLFGARNRTLEASRIDLRLRSDREDDEVPLSHLRIERPDRDASTARPQLAQPTAARNGLRVRLDELGSDLSQDRRDRQHGLPLTAIPKRLELDHRFLVVCDDPPRLALPASRHVGLDWRAIGAWQTRYTRAR